MNKKLTAMVTSLTLGGTLLFGTAFVNASQLSGYETYKSAVMNTKDIKNGTANLKVTVANNGNSVLDLNSNVKMNLASNAVSSETTVKSGSTTQTFSSYNQDGKSIAKDSTSNEYLVRENKNKDLKKISEAENPTVTKSVEVIIDTLVGSMQNKVTTTDNTDGTKNISIDLNENEVTPLVNALSSIAFTQGNHKDFKEAKNGKDDMQNIENVLPKFEGEVKVKSVTSTGSINKDNVITNQTAKIVLSGKDAKGQEQEITFNVDLSLSNINKTTPDKVDLSGKQVKTVNFHHGEED